MSDTREDDGGDRSLDREFMDFGKQLIEDQGFG